MNVIDPIQFCKLIWPDVTLYDKQREILYSVRDNDETFVPAGNALGKDFVSAICALWFFCSRRPARVVTTSVQAGQLNDVLWGEIRRLLNTAKYKLPIQYNQMYIRQVTESGEFVPLCELAGQVVNKGEALLGRHLARNGLPRTLVIFDEASGIDSGAYESSDTWAHRKLIIGNPYPCTNFFYKGVKGGDLPKPLGKGLYRKVIKIRAIDSPNIKLAERELATGKPLSGREIIPGVVGYELYLKRRSLWDKVRQSVGLDAEFYEGVETLLYPPEWLNRSEEIAKKLKEQKRLPKTMGIDPAEGGDSTVWAIIDELGLIKLFSQKTPDTTIIGNNTIGYMQEFGIKAKDVYFDRGGGGKQIADALRAKGHKVTTVAFGETATAEKRRGMTPLEERKLQDEIRYTYKNRRAEMYGLLRERMGSEDGFGLPLEYDELRRQLAPMPLLFDGEGRLFLPPKNKRSPTSTEATIRDLIGCSPDEADALVLAVYGLHRKRVRVKVGAF